MRLLVEMAEKYSLTWWPLFVFAGGAFSLFLSLVMLALAADAVSARRRRRAGQGTGRSGIYSGHVWHARFKPTAHRFSYPIFYCLLDLDELDVAFPW